ncbi:putative quinol monooxygenase [Pelagerythrobacter aerophilus]
MRRRDAIAMLAVQIAGMQSLAATTFTARKSAMFVLLNKILCESEARQSVAETMTRAARSLSDCLFYCAVPDSGDAEAIWVFEIWPDEAAHAASLQSPEVGAAIQQARPSIKGAERVFAGSDAMVARAAIKPDT